MPLGVPTSSIIKLIMASTFDRSRMVVESPSAPSLPARASNHIRFPILSVLTEDPSVVISWTCGHLTKYKHEGRLRGGPHSGPLGHCPKFRGKQPYKEPSNCDSFPVCFPQQNER